MAQRRELTEANLVRAEQALHRAVIALAIARHSNDEHQRRNALGRAEEHARDAHQAMRAAGEAGDV